MIKLARLSTEEFLQAGLSFSDKFPSFWFFLNNSLDCKTFQAHLVLSNPSPEIRCVSKVPSDTLDVSGPPFLQLSMELKRCSARDSCIHISVPINFLNGEFRPIWSTSNIRVHANLCACRFCSLLPAMRQRPLSSKLHFLIC